MARDFSGWAQVVASAAIATIGVIFFMGSANSSLADTKQKVEALQQQQQADHDKVTTLDSKVDDVKADVSEIKQDVKKLLERK